MVNTSNETERLIKIALIAMVVGYGLSRNKGLVAVGLIAYFAGNMKNFQIAEFIQKLKDGAFSLAESNDQPIE